MNSEDCVELLPRQPEDPSSVLDGFGSMGSLEPEETASDLRLNAAFSLPKSLRLKVKIKDPANYRPYTKKPWDVAIPIQTIPVGGDESIAVTDTLILDQDSPEMSKVRGWGCELDVLTTSISVLRDALGRRFIDLYHRGQRRELSEAEMNELGEISRQVDIGAYNYLLDRRPRYHEAILQSQGGTLKLEFLTGGVRDVGEEVRLALRPMKEGEWFGADFVFDRYGKIESLSNPRPVPDPDKVEAED